MQSPRCRISGKSPHRFNAMPQKVCDLGMARRTIHSRPVL
jgi:hypothetical protein